MAKNVDDITEEIRKLSDVEKLRLLETIVSDHDKPDPRDRPGVGGGGAQTVVGLQSRQSADGLVRVGDGKIPKQLRGQA